MKRTNSRALGLVRGRPRIFSARELHSSDGKTPRHRSSQRASVAPCPRRARKRAGMAMRPRSSSAWRNSPVRKDAWAMVGFLPLLPILPHLDPQAAILQTKAGPSRVFAESGMGDSYGAPAAVVGGPPGGQAVVGIRGVESLPARPERKAWAARSAGCARAP